MIIRTFITTLLITGLLRAEAQIICIRCFDQNEPVSASVVNLVQNGGFENHTCPPPDIGMGNFCPNAEDYDCDIFNWTCIGGGADSYPHFKSHFEAHVAEGVSAAYLGNWFPLPCSELQNDTTCLQDVGCVVTGVPIGYPHEYYDDEYEMGGTTGVSLQQTVSGLTVGALYTLEFWAGGEWDFGLFADRGIFAVDIGFGYTYLRCRGTGEGMIGTRYLITFAAVAPEHTITFTNWGHISDFATEVILDDVRLFHIKNNPCTVDVPETGYATAPRVFMDAGALVVQTSGTYVCTLVLYNTVGEEVKRVGITGSARVELTDLSGGIYVYALHSAAGRLAQGRAMLE